MQQKSRMLFGVSIAVAAIIIGFLVVSAMGFSLSAGSSSASTTTTTSNSDSPTNSTATPGTVVFTIIESDTGPMKGMNGSAYHVTESWPVIQVQKGQTVIIHVISENSSEPHGFTIIHYFYPGVTLLPGGSYTLEFVANEQGTFLVTCLIFCAIHPLMDFGELIVGP